MIKLAFLIFFILVTLSTVRPDSLLDTMRTYWGASPEIQYPSPCESREPIYEHEIDSEGEVYHWELGTPDNEVPTEVIVDPYVHESF